MLIIERDRAFVLLISYYDDVDIDIGGYNCDEGDGDGDGDGEGNMDEAID